MARPKKQTVDYFPHYCDHKKTMFILEQKYGNDGYSFWFKLLEILGKYEGHFINLNNTGEWEFLTSYTRLADDTCCEILNLLAKLEAIDQELWQQKIVWSQNFVNGIADAYRNRRTDTPNRPDYLLQKPINNGVSDVRNPQTKLYETKLKDIKSTPKKISYAEYVTMTNDEYEKLLATYGKEMTAKMIETLDNYKGANGKKYKSDYRAILNWVVKRIEEETNNPKGLGSKGRNQVPRAFQTIRDYGGDENEQ